MTIGTNRMCISRDDNCVDQHHVLSTTTPVNCKKTLYDDLLSLLYCDECVTSCPNGK